MSNYYNIKTIDNNQQKRQITNYSVQRTMFSLLFIFMFSQFCNQQGDFQTIGRQDAAPTMCA